MDCQRWILATLETLGPLLPATLCALAATGTAYRPMDLDYALARLATARQITRRRGILDLA